MTLLQAVSTRLTRSDMLQLSVLFFAVLLVSSVTAWPTRPNEANDSWFALSQARLGALSLLALGFGAVQSGFAKAEQGVTVLSLLALALLSTPLEVASYALSFPSQPLWYSLMLALLDSLALFGLGILLGKLLALIRLRALLPLAVPALLVGLVAADIWLGVALVSPLAAADALAPLHLGAMGAAALLTTFYLLPFRFRTPREDSPA